MTKNDLIKLLRIAYIEGVADQSEGVGQPTFDGASKRANDLLSQLIDSGDVAIAEEEVVSGAAKASVIKEFTQQLKRELYPQVKTAGDCVTTTVSVAGIIRVSAHCQLAATNNNVSH